MTECLARLRYGGVNSKRWEGPKSRNSNQCQPWAPHVKSRGELHGSYGLESSPLHGSNGYTAGL